MGFNNEGADIISKRLARLKASGRWPSVPVGINIGKSKVTPNSEAVSDYATSFRLLQPYGDYFTINVSSPNTPELRALQAAESLSRIIRAIRALDGGKPVLVKISPDLDEQQIAEIAELALQAKPGTAALSFEDPKLICVIRLLLWLHLEGVEVEHLFYNKIILDILTKRFIEIENIDPKIAREAATIAISIALAVGTFAPMLEMTGVSEIQPVRDLWRHILLLLAQHPPQ
jgi:hypothetical protein